MQSLENNAKLEGDSTLLKLARAQRSLPVHPAQLYSAFTAFLLAGVCLAYFPMRRFNGAVFAMMVMLESIARYLLEIVRTEPSVTHIFGFGWSISMVLSAGLLLMGIALWFAFSRGDPRQEPLLA
jgi:prolipoprotein diacylglyceryltransferase